MSDTEIKKKKVTKKKKKDEKIIEEKDEKKYQKYSLNHHIYEQAEIYHKIIKPSETWVIHWTTVDKKITFQFPKSDTVNILHICHDKLFHKIKIITKDNVEEVENILPILKRKFEQKKDEKNEKKQKIEGN